MMLSGLLLTVEWLQSCEAKLRTMVEMKIVLRPPEVAQPGCLLQADIVAGSASALRRCTKACRESVDRWVTR